MNDRIIAGGGGGVYHGPNMDEVEDGVGREEAWEKSVFWKSKEGPIVGGARCHQGRSPGERQGRGRTLSTRPSGLSSVARAMVFII